MKPREIHPGSCYLITRRCTQRQFWLRPSALINQIILYCMAYSAQRYNIQLIAICALSNHYHAVVCDPDGRLPRFLESAHKLIAKCINCEYERWENLWSSDEPSVVRLEDDAAVLDKIAYTLANPVSSFLVRRGARWPGVRTRPGDIAGAEYVVERPAIFFREDGPMPTRLTLRIERPDICPELSDGALADLVEDLVAQREAEWRATRAQQGLGFVGVKEVLRQEPSDTPTSETPRRNLSPRVAAGDPEVLERALQRQRRFEIGHREAWLAWRTGQRDVIFPAGTYAMRWVHGVNCAAARPP